VPRLRQPRADRLSTVEGLGSEAPQAQRQARTARREASEAHRIAADASARIVTMPTMVAVPVADTAQMRRLVEFASDVAELADRRPDLDLRDLIDGLHADLRNLKEHSDDD
jgi:hypothetical protein